MREMRDYGNFFKVGMKGFSKVADQSGGLTATWGLGDLRVSGSGVRGLVIRDMMCMYVVWHGMVFANLPRMGICAHKRFVLKRMGRGLS